MKKGRLEKDPQALWKRFVDWLYQHKELGLYIDVSRVGFTDEFVNEMEPKFRAAFKAMNELEKGAIANPDEGRMVGHYWLRNSNLAPTSRLKKQIDTALESVCAFAQDVISGKVSSLYASVLVLFLALEVYLLFAVFHLMKLLLKYRSNLHRHLRAALPKFCLLG